MTLDEIAVCDDVTALWTCMQQAKVADDSVRVLAVKTRMAELAGDMTVRSVPPQPKLVAHRKDGRSVAVDRDWDPVIKSVAQQLAERSI